jgi:hypothetical protein
MAMVFTRVITVVTVAALAFIAYGWFVKLSAEAIWVVIFSPLIIAITSLSLFSSIKALRR